MLRRHHRRADPLWDVAASVQVFGASCFPPDSRVGQLLGRARQGGQDGVLLASRHPTGWFVRAVRRDDLSVEELRALRELVTVRSYLLLRQGPVPPVWTPGPGDGEWQSGLPALADELASMAGDFRAI